MALRFWSVAAALIFLFPHPVPAQQPAAFVGTVRVAPADGLIMIKPDNGQPMALAIEAETILQRIAPGEKSLKNAATIQAADIALNDRVLVNLAPDSKNVRRIVVMASGDIAQKNNAERQDWTKRGLSGLVVSKTADTIRLRKRSMAGEETLTVTVTGKTIYRRYAPDSVKFADAQTSALTEIAPGDQLCARGVKSADGLTVAAEEVVSGAFQTKAGTITSVDPAAREITIQELGVNKPLIVKLSPDSQMKSMPDFSKMFGAGGAPPNAPPGGAPPGGAPGAGFKPPDFAQMLEHMPAAKLEDLKPGATVVVSSTKGAASDRITAIMLLANAEFLVRMASMQRSGGAAGAAPRGMGAGMGAGMGGGMPGGAGGLDLGGMIPGMTP